jgi:hypothetical protein
MKRVLPDNHDEWPEWHHRPLRLTVREMNDPLSVLNIFFTFYSLPDVREKLRFWLDEVFYNNENPPAFLVDFYSDIEKLVEAAFLIEKRSGPRIADVFNA